VKFDLIRPCPHCPFRTDIRPFLTPKRAREIGDAITRQQLTFTCHETTVLDESDEGGMRDGPNAQHCAGVLIMLEKFQQPNQLMRWMERIGKYDRRKLEMTAPVFDDAGQFVDAQKRRKRNRREH
jgi:hypothetical protein